MTAILLNQLSVFNNVFHNDIFFGCFYNLDPDPRPGPGPWAQDPDPDKPGP